jgi:hypothetical protein
MRKRFLILLLIFGLSATGVAYSQTSYGSEVGSWLSGKVNEVKTSVNLTLLNLVKVQKDVLSNTSDNNVSELSEILSAMGSTVNDSTSSSILQVGKNHENELVNKSDTLESQTEKSFSEFTVQLNTQTDQIIKLVDSDYQQALETGNGNVTSFEDKNNQEQHTNEKLVEEIELTRSSIEELESIQKTEVNPIVKDYIQGKIDLLKELIILLET